MAEIQRRSLLAGVLALGAGACSKIAASDTGQSLFEAAEDAVFKLFMSRTMI
jgi:hypothetical protein